MLYFKSYFVIRFKVQLGSWSQQSQTIATFNQYHPESPSKMGSAVLPHLRTGWHVDQAILNEEERMVVIRFGRDHDPDCMRQDEVLYKIADRVKNFAVVYRKFHIKSCLKSVYVFLAYLL